jgi:hypothetical protein
MTAPKGRRGTTAWKELLCEDHDLLREMIHTVVSQMLAYQAGGPGSAARARGVGERGPD